MDFEVGQWVTFTAPNGWTVRGQVVDRRESPSTHTVDYTLHAFPDALKYTDYTP